MKIAVLGAGAWGTALAKMLASKGEDVSLWFFDQSAFLEAEKTRINPFLPKEPLPKNLFLTTSLSDSLRGAEMVLYVSPAQAFRQVMKKARPFLSSKVIIVNCAKGIEYKKFCLLSEIMDEILPVQAKRAVYLSGPSFADEVAAGQDTAVVLASRDTKSARLAQGILANNYFRPYTSRDIIGVQIAGAYKNVLAIAAGIIAGQGSGENLQAALLSRGLREMSRFGQALGAKQDTFLGLAGVGDLVLTARSNKSRNYRFGKEIGFGAKPTDLIEKSGAVIEGYWTALAISKQSKKMGIKLTIADEVCKILFKRAVAKESIRHIMTRELKAE